MNIGHVIPEIRSWTDRHADRQTDRQTRSSQYSARLSGAVQQRATVLGVVQIVRRSNEACDSVRFAYRSVFIIMTLSDTAIRPSVCPSVCPSPRRATAVSYRYAGCLQLSHVRTADPSADGRRSAASRTAIGGGHIVSPPPGR